MRRKNPKGFLIGDKQRKSKDNMFGTVSTIDKEIQKMRKKLEDLEPRCNSNEDCTKDTCCRNAAEVEDIKKMDIDWGSDDEKE